MPGGFAKVPFDIKGAVEKGKMIGDGVSTMKGMMNKD